MLPIAASRVVPLPECGLCARRYWTVEDDGVRVRCRRLTIPEMREWWAHEDRPAREQAQRAWMANAYRRLGIEPKPIRARETATYGGSMFDRIKAAYSIEQILGRMGVWLPAGRDRGTIPCPLHNERRGRAFSYDLQRQRWKCWGACGIGGDVIDLVDAAESRGALRI